MPQLTMELRRLLDEALIEADRINPLVAAYIAQALAMIEPPKDQSNCRWQ